MFLRLVKETLYYLQAPASFIIRTVFKRCYNVLNKSVPVLACFISAAVLVLDMMLWRSLFLHTNHVYLSSHSTPPQKYVSLHIILSFVQVKE